MLSIPDRRSRLITEWHIVGLITAIFIGTSSKFSPSMYGAFRTPAHCSDTSKVLMKWIGLDWVVLDQTVPGVAVGFCWGLISSLGSSGQVLMQTVADPQQRIAKLTSLELRRTRPTLPEVATSAGSPSRLYVEEKGESIHVVRHSGSPGLLISCNL